MPVYRTTTITDYDLREPWENFGNAIIEQAAKDYRAALEKLQNLKEISTDTKWYAISTIWRLNVFFRSEWYKMLTKVDPEYIIENLNKHYGNDDITELVNKSTSSKIERI